MVWTQRAYDSFTDADDTPLTTHTPNQGSTWIVDAGQADIYNNQARSGNATVPFCRNTTTLENKQAAEINILVVETGGVFTRMSNAGGVDGYRVLDRKAPFLDRYIYRYDNGTATQLATDGNYHASNDLIRLESDGSTHTALINGSTPLQTTDATYDSGQAGLSWENGYVLVDAFRAYDEAAVAGVVGTERIWVGA
jgi:hypothetical protein